MIGYEYYDEFLIFKNLGMSASDLETESYIRFNIIKITSNVTRNANELNKTDI